MPQKKKLPIINTQSGRAFDSTYNVMLQSARNDLQKLYPGRKVDIQQASGYRAPSTQAGLVKKGASTTDISLHAINAAKDFQIYVDGKAIKDPNVYHDVLWKNAEKHGLYHLDPKGFGAVDLGHIGVIEEDGKSTYGRLLDKYPDVADSQEFSELQEFVNNKVATGKATEKEKLVYNQLQGQRYTPELWYKPMYPTDNTRTTNAPVQKRQVPITASVPTAAPKATQQYKIPKVGINRQPYNPAAVIRTQPAVQSVSPTNVPVVSNNTQAESQQETVPELTLTKEALEGYKNRIYSTRPKEFNYKEGGKVPSIYVDNINDPRYRAYQDSLYVRTKRNQKVGIGNKTRPLTQKEKEFWKDEETGLVPNVVEFHPESPTTWGYFGHFKKPEQQVILGQQINKLPIGYKGDVYSPTPVPVGIYKPKIQNEWYSNKVGVPIDADNVDALYNQDGTRKYQNGGTVMNKKIRIKAAPQYAVGGWAQQIGGRLNTSWNQPGFYDREGQVDVRTTLPKVPRDMANAVLENDEIAMIPTEDGMGVQKAASDSHASGNDHPTVLEEGSMILSDTKSLKEKDASAQKMFNMPYKKSGYTYAEFGAKPMRVFNKAQKFLNSKEAKADPAKTNTEMLNAQNSTAKLQQAFQLQEMRKQERGIGQPTMEARYGGRMYYDGGFADDTDNPDVYEAPPIIKKPIAPIPTTVTGQRMYPIINPIAARTLTGNNNWQPAEPSGDNIGTVPAPDYPVPYAGNRFTPTAPTASIDKTKRGKDRGISSGITAANISDAVTAAKLLSIKKHLPWEPAVNVKYPNMLLESDQPIRNVLAEQTNQLTNAMYSGNSQVGRAAAQNAQAEQLRRSVQAAGEVSNKNVNTYNQFEQLRSQLGTGEDAAKRERAKRIYDGTIIANQQYTNAMNAGLDVVAKTAAEREEQAAFLHNQNMTNPYYQLDRTGKLRWNPGNTRERYMSEVVAGRPGSGVSGNEGALYKQLVDQYSEYMRTDLAEQAAYDKVFGKSQTVREKTKVGNTETIKTTKKKYGGYMNKLPKK